jgi:hypothetical protein
VAADVSGVAFVYMEHDELGPIRVPDEAGVVEWHEARGYRRADEPEPEPYVPPKDAPPSTDGFVPLVHPDLPGVVHDWPDNPEALQGAHEAGWRYPAAKPEGESEGEPDEKPAKKTAAKKAAASADDQDKE